MKMIRFTALSILSIALLCAGSIQAREFQYRQGQDTPNLYDVKNLAYYGDWDSNRIFVIDIDNWNYSIVEGTGEGPYGIDQQGPDKAYALTRKTESLTIIDNYTLENVGQINLQHKPRSTNYNANTDLTAVSGGDKVMTSIIRVDHDKVVKVIGYDTETHPEDFGGSLSTGHPLWLDDTRFFMLDRAEREIQLWNRNGDLLSTLATTTSVHHLFQPPKETMKAGDENIFYATAEGFQGDHSSSKPISPSIIRFEVRGRRLDKTGEVALSSYDSEFTPKPSVMGAHHADFHPDGVHIYVGSTEGHVFVINKNSMKVKHMIDAGPGAGHTTFAPMHNLAIVTNHNATFMTAINTKNHTEIQNIEVASEADPAYKSQAHTSGISPDMKYFYSAASHDGVFFKIGIDEQNKSEYLKVVEKLELEYIDIDHKTQTPNILMGSFIWGGDGVNM